MNRKYFSGERSSSVSFWTTSRERGPITPMWGIDGVIHSTFASRPSNRSPKNSSWSLPLVITQQWPSRPVLNTVASSTSQPVGIDERAVARLPDLEPEHVVAERPLDAPERVGSAELPLVQW